MDPLADVFEKLDRWRQLPAYQLERRADIFFAVYLPDVLANYTGVQMDQRVIPEFPIKRDLIWPSHRSNKSVKVDYVLFAQDRSRCYFVELKTDTQSRRLAQDEYLARAKEVGFGALLNGLLQIVRRTTAHQKYYHLLCVLEDLGFLRLPERLLEHLYPEAQPGLIPLLDGISLEPVDPPVEVVYLQPDLVEGEATIDFEFFAGCLAEYGDPLSRLFREHLLKWRRPAGSVPPDA